MNGKRTTVAVLFLTILFACVAVGVVSAENVENTSATEEVGVLENTEGLEFDKIFGGSDFDNTDSVVQTSDGGFALAGRQNSGEGSNAWLIKTNSSGDLEFDSAFDLSDLDIANSVIQTSDDGFALVGRTFQDSEGNVGGFLVKTDSSGNSEFDKTLGGDEDENLISVTQTEDGGYALVGFKDKSTPEGRNRDGWFVKTDSGGNVEFEKTFGGSGGDKLRSVVETPNGSFALGGTFGTSGSGDDDFWLLKTDSNGNMELNETYDKFGEEEGFSLIQTIDGGFALAGWTRPILSTDNDAWLLKTYENGTKQWDRTYGGDGVDLALSAVQTDYGGFALGGDSDSYEGDGSEFWLVRTEPNGTEIWNNTYGGSGFDRAEDVIQTEDGSFALAGQTDSFDSSDTDGWFAKTRFCVDTTGDGNKDSDGDSLCDNWESEGVDVDGDGDSDFDLHQAPYNADPMHKDLFLEIDYMQSGPGEARSHQPRQNALQNVRNAFANAPVPNPDGNQGINLHIRVDTPGNNIPESQSLNHQNVLNYTGTGPATDFDTVKDNNFGDPRDPPRGDTDEKRLARRLTHRYAIFAHRIEQGDLSSGKAEGIPGNDFIVTLGRGGNVGTRVQQESTLMHEFGHLLGLRHGGLNDRNCKPNYLSVMSYTRQFPGNMPGSGVRPLDYSNQSLPTLDENNLNEAVGIQGPAGLNTTYDSGTNKSLRRSLLTGNIVGVNFSQQVGPANGPIDWNNDSDSTDNSVSRDINWIFNSNVKCGGDADFDGNPDGLTKLRGHDDWANLEYNFRGTPAFADGAHPTPPGTQEQPPSPLDSEPSTLAVETNVSSVEVDSRSGLLVNVTDAADDAPVEGATVNVTGAGVEVPDKTTDADGTATFTVNPDEAGDITVTAAKSGFSPGQTVVESRKDGGGSPVEGVSDELWTAVTQEDEEDGLSLSDLGNAIQEYQKNPSDADVDGAPITLADLGSLIQYYRNEVV